MSLRRLFEVPSKLVTTVNRVQIAKMSSQALQLEIKHDPQQHEFYTMINNEKAMLQYNMIDEVYDMYHTFVPTTLRGRGIAHKLAYTAFEHVQTTGAKMKLTCSFLEHLQKTEQDFKYNESVV